MQLLGSVTTKPSVRRFGLNLFIYGTILLLEGALIFVLMGLTGGGMGMSLAVGLLLVSGLMSIPGMVLSSLLLLRTATGRHPRLAGGIGAGLVSAIAMAVVAVALVAQNPASDPVDRGPAIVLYAIVAAVTGLAAGGTIVAFHQALAKPFPPRLAGYPDTRTR